MEIANTYQNPLWSQALSAKTPSSLESAKKSNDQEKIAQAAEDFEAFFITRTMESMFEGVSTDGMFGGGHAEKIYRSMLFNEYGKVMAKTGGIGVKDEVMRSILQMQEMASMADARNGIDGRLL